MFEIFDFSVSVQQHWIIKFYLNIFYMFILVNVYSKQVIKRQVVHK